MALAKKVNVVQALDLPIVPAEIIAQDIQKISKAMEDMEKSRLSKKALLVLLKNATGINFYEIEKVLDALRDLEKDYLKPTGKRNAK